MGRLAGRVAQAPPWYLRAVSRVIRWLDGYPGIKSFLPFVPIILLWAAIARSGMFPRIFFPGPLDQHGTPHGVRQARGVDGGIPDVAAAIHAAHHLRVHANALRRKLE
jgi:hypothetical protein